MLHEKITLSRTGVILETYLADEESLKQSIKRPFPHRPLVLVFPGGGYHFLSDREAEPVALRLLSLGIQAVVVRYSVAPARYPVALEQAAEAMQYAREHAEQWLCDSRKIAVMGFSAGGHAAAHLGTRWHEMGFDPVCRPDAMILSYPVITSGEFAHRNSFKCLLAEREEELKDVVSLEKHVTPDTPPTFLWHTWTDELVPVENSLMFAAALRRTSVPCEMHIFGVGQHGLSLCNDQVYDAEQPNMHAECACWIDMAARWLKGL